MKKYTIVAFIALGIMLVTGSIQAQVASDAGNEDAQNVAAAVVTSADSDNDQNVVAPGVSANADTDDNQNASNTVGVNSGTDDDQNVGQVTPPVTPVTPPSTNTGSGGSSGSSSGGSSGGGSSYTAPTATLTSLGASITTCPLITSYVKIDGTNNRDTVSRLQIFLSTSEKLAVDINGIFDAKTEAAVKSFQKKYANDILTPWGATLPSGKVYITTTKKINELACAQSLTLSANEAAIIAAYKEKLDAGTPAQTTETVTPAPQNETTTPATDEVGDATTPGTENTAAVANTSIISRFWHFITGLFN